MSASRRHSVALVTGPTAGYLAPVLADAARMVVLVRDPLSAVRGTSDPQLKKSALEDLSGTPADSVPARMLLIANPQSRALLAPWHDPAELVVSTGPPDDADRWREALFGDVLPLVDATAVEDAAGVARDLARSLGGRPKPVAQAARAIAGEGVGGAEDVDMADLLLRLNWLDAELHDRCVS
jgi:hypothetical protein